MVIKAFYSKMGTAASTTATSPVISPRVEAFAKTDEPVLLDSPVLLDLSHGTVRYRLPDERAKVKKAKPPEKTRTAEQQSKGEKSEDTKQGDEAASKVKTGYFYHPRLADYSEDAEIPLGEQFKFYYVFKGPPRTKNKKLYYVYGTSQDAKDEGIRHEEYRPKGKGYDWPESYRKANSLYYDLTFLGPDEEGFLDSDSDGESQVSGTTDYTNELDKSNIKLKLHDTDTAESVKNRLTLRLLIPVINIHLQYNKVMLRNEDIVGDLRTEEDGSWATFGINLKLT